MLKLQHSFELKLYFHSSTHYCQTSCDAERYWLCPQCSWGLDKGQLQSHGISEKKKAFCGQQKAALPALGEGWVLIGPAEKRGRRKAGKWGLAEVFICRAGGGLRPTEQEIS